ncbi:MAG: ATP phosphoribosyltransferase regulatory subunit [Methanoculleus sp. SDB]|nr:MAG: ATP phosphoribosyltransferase regulatory subunit [Methanoculleus sp. SDB]
MLQKPRGTRDFLPGEMRHRRAVERCMRETAEKWGYGEVCTPIFEEAELFTLRSGEGIIHEMYAFEDKGGRMLALRPEITASVLRMYVNEGRVLPKPVRWSYVADCFRYERPQKGRYRQFWQFGIELIGADTAAADAEVVLVGADVLAATGVSFDMHIGHLAPMKFLLSGLDPQVQRRMMAYLDKRDFDGLRTFSEETGTTDRYDALKALPECRTIEEMRDLCGDLPELSRIGETLAILDAEGLEYTLDFGIARGLDYYTGMVFEAFAENLGAENQILGGGAYRLAYLFGGDDVASCGFAIGFDRVLVSLGGIDGPRPPVLGILYTPGARHAAFAAARRFRREGVHAELNLIDRGIGAQMKHAAKNADFVVLLGERECIAGTVTLKNLHSGEQRECGVEDAIAEVKAFGAC